MSAVGEQDGGNSPAALLERLYKTEAFGAVIDIYPLVRDPVLGEGLLGALAVRAPRSSIHLDLGHRSTPHDMNEVGFGKQRAGGDAELGVGRRRHRDVGQPELAD